jgi:propanol-preferring alcohol dehydrogenase
VLNGITIRGSIVGTHLDLEEVFRLHVEGRTKVLRETRKLESVNESFEEVLREETASPRLVFTFDT